MEDWDLELPIGISSDPAESVVAEPSPSEQSRWLAEIARLRADAERREVALQAESREQLAEAARREKALRS